MTTAQQSAPDFTEDMAKLMQALPAPYILLRDGDPIFPGCLLGNPDTGMWVLAAVQHWDTRYEGGFYPVAAPACPEGFQIIHGECSPADNAMIWRKSEPYWCQLPEIWRGLHLSRYWHTQPSVDHIRYKKQPALMYLLAADAFICHPVENSWRTTPIPEQFRALGVGDTVRKGDKVICAETPSWVGVSSSVYGAAVRAETTETARFARPIPANWHTWFVDLRCGRGSDKHGDGLKHSTACASVNGMLNKITKNQQLYGIPQYGIIWDVRGVPIHVLDVPLDAPLEYLGNVPHSIVSGVPHTIQWLLQHLTLAGEPASQNSLLQLAHEAMPDKHRELTAAEVCQEHDLIFTTSPGDRLPLMWQPAAARLWHSPGSRQHIFCRHVDAPTRLESPEIRLLHHGERIARIERILGNMAEQIKEMHAQLAGQTLKS